MSSEKIKIAIDGPAASGKSTTARQVARRLNYTYIDSGAMYRAITWKGLALGVAMTDREKMIAIARNSHFEFQVNGDHVNILLDGDEVNGLIRSPEVTDHVNTIAAYPEVRTALVDRQRLLGKAGGIVMDGRDIATVVFPDAELKIYMKAAAGERARRRVEELQKKGVACALEDILADIKRRDAADCEREWGPLKRAEAAVVIDTTHLSIDDQVEKIYLAALDCLQKKNHFE